MQVEFKYSPASQGADPGTCQRKTAFFTSLQAARTSFNPSQQLREEPAPSRRGNTLRPFFDMLMPALDENQHRGKFEGEERP